MNSGKVEAPPVPETQDTCCGLMSVCWQGGWQAPRAAQRAMPLRRAVRRSHGKAAQSHRCGDTPCGDAHSGFGRRVARAALDPEAGDKACCHRPRSPAGPDLLNKGPKTLVSFKIEWLQRAVCPERNQCDKPRGRHPKGSSVHRRHRTGGTSGLHRRPLQAKGNHPTPALEATGTVAGPGVASRSSFS